MEKENNHYPPIPPCCDLFYEPYFSKGPYWIINNLSKTSICLSDTDPDDRKIIAAVAMRAWKKAKVCLENIDFLEWLKGSHVCEHMMFSYYETFRETCIERWDEWGDLLNERLF